MINNKTIQGENKIITYLGVCFCIVLLSEPVCTKRVPDRESPVLDKITLIY